MKNRESLIKNLKNLKLDESDNHINVNEHNNNRYTNPNDNTTANTYEYMIQNANSVQRIDLDQDNYKSNN